MATKYETSLYSTEIRRRDNVVGETDCFVHLRSSHDGHIIRERKRTQYSQWHDTFEDAKAFLIARYEEERDGLLERLRNVEKKLEEVGAMRE